MNEFVGYIDDQGRVFDGTFDYEGHVGPIGPQGEPGYTPQREIDYWTDEDKAYVVAEATSLINGKIEEYNANATAKTNAFNQNASDKTNAFNSNASDKTTAFDNNASTKTATFNINAASKKSDFNDNAAAKTTAFDAHVDSEFDDLTGNFYTKAQVDAKIASTYHYKGSVTDYTELPSSGQQVGDVYNIETAGGGYNAGDNAAWTGTAWDILAGTVDLTNYYTKSETNTLLDTKQGTIDSSHKVDADLIDDTTSTNKFTTSSDISKLSGIESGAEVNVIETVKVDGTALEVTDKAVDIVGLAAMQSELDDLYAQIPTATATGNPINVQDSSNLPIVDFAMSGNATQQTYTGKNLFNKNNYNAFNGYLETSTSKVVSADGNNIVYIPCKKNTNYTVSKVVTKRFGVGCTVDVPANNVVVSQLSNNYTATSITITTTAEANYLVAWVRNANISGEVSLENVLNSLQIEEGSTATTYEPYTGGTSAPNPDYPQDIHVVTGDNTVKVLGKNLFNKNNVTQNYRLGSGGAPYGDNAYVLSPYIRIEPSTQYSFNELKSSECVCTYDKDKNFLSRTIYGSAYSKTTENNACYVRVAVTKDNIDIWQLSKGTTATPYEPYTEQTQLLSLGSIELAKIGTYTDRIFKDSGKWYVEKNIEKLVLNGTETWATWNNINDDIGFYSYINTALGGNVENNYNDRALMNLFSEAQTQPSIKDGNAEGMKMCGPYSSSIYLAIGIAKTRLSDYSTQANAVASFKTWLSTNTPILYYILKEPTTTEITDTTLLGQLEELLKKRTNKNVTNISIVPTGTNAEPTGEWEYRVDLGTVIGNINNAIISLGGNV